jgi:hypothetical protein
MSNDSPWYLQPVAHLAQKKRYSGFGQFEYVLYSQSQTMYIVISWYLYMYGISILCIYQWIQSPSVYITGLPVDLTPYCPYGTIVHSWYYSPLWTGTDSESLNREIVFVHHEQCILQCVYAVNFRKHSNDLVDALYRGREKMWYFSSGLWREILTPWYYCLFLHLYTLIIIDSW